MRRSASHVCAAMLVLSVALLVGCGKKENSEATGARVDTAAPAAGATTGSVRTYDFRGIVRKIDRERNRLTLEHENIGDWMQAMTMPFPVSDPAMLDQVEQDKKYRFTIEVSDDTYKLTKIQPDDSTAG